VPQLLRSSYRKAPEYLELLRRKNGRSADLYGRPPLAAAGIEEAIAAEIPLVVW
jgi:hypothetical protein